MNAPIYLEGTPGIDTQNLIEETAAVLTLLAYTLSIIAQPGTAPMLGKVLAVLAQHTASTWAVMLSADIPPAQEVV